MRHFILSILLLTSVGMFGQLVPGSKQTKPVAIVGVTAHIGDGNVLQNAVVAFADGKITYVGGQADAPNLANHTVIQAEGKDVYPGFIAMDSKLGLVEIDAVRATNDQREVGYYNPNARSIIAFNTDSEVIPTVRNIGVLVAQVSPTGSGLVGQSSAVTMDGWNWEDAVLGLDEGMHLKWPKSFYSTGWWAAPGGLKKNKDYDQDVRDLEHYFTEAKAYAVSKEVVDNPRFRSMEAVFSGERTLYIHATYAREIEDAIAFGQQYGVKMVLVGARDAMLVKEKIKAAGIGVVCGEVHALPLRTDDVVSQPFEMPAQLQAAGIPIAFSLAGAWEQRRLPHHAGHAVGFGLPYEEAVKGLTLAPAQMLGISDRVGSLEVGKDATLFLSAGDALDMRTNKLEHAFIEGRQVDLRSRQTMLADKYRQKYQRGE